MSKLGQAVLYTVPVAHETETTLEKIAGAVESAAETLLGSVHHQAMRQFAGTVGRENADGTCDIQILVPNREARWVDGVAEGTEPGTFAFAAGGAMTLTEGQAAGADVMTAAAAATTAARDAASSAGAASNYASSASSNASSAGVSASNAASSANSAVASANDARVSANDAKAAAEKVIGATAPPASATAAVGTDAPTSTAAA
jgi:hypothetical protein